jgi:hypothetical protein
MMMTTIEALISTTAAYFIWAIVFSDSFFHRIWSLALTLLEASVLILPHLWPSWSAYYLILFIIIDFILCVVLSPLQRFIFPVSSRQSTFPSIEEVTPHHSKDTNPEHDLILAE